MRDDSEIPGSDKKLPPLSKEESAALLPAAVGDDRSVAETKQLTSGLPERQLKKTAEENEAERTENFRDHFERLAVATLYLAWIVLVLIGVTWVYHLLAPPSWPRLPDDQVQQLHSIVTGAILSSLAGGHFKKRLNHD